MHTHKDGQHILSLSPWVFLVCVNLGLATLSVLWFPFSLSLSLGPVAPSSLIFCLIRAEGTWRALGILWMEGKERRQVSPRLTAGYNIYKIPTSMSKISSRLRMVCYSTQNTTWSFQRKQVKLYISSLIYIHIYISTYIYMYIYTCIYTYIYIYIHVYIHIYTYTHIYMYMYTCMYMYIYIYIHTHTHTHTHTYIYIHIPSRKNLLEIGLSKVSLPNDQFASLLKMFLT